MTKYYTGVGARKTPQVVLSFMTEFAIYMQTRKWILRSGGAAGADTAFEDGVLLDKYKNIFYAHDCTAAVRKIAKAHISWWDNCSEYAKQLHGRNVFQILGKDLKTPSEFVICWTPGGEQVGGTRTAIVIAKTYNIPVVNLGHPDRELTIPYVHDKLLSYNIVI